MCENNCFNIITTAEAIEYCNKNNFTYRHITGKDFRDKILTQHEYGNSLCYTATSGADAILPFSQAVENISREADRNYLEIHASTQNVEHMNKLILIFIHCLVSRASYGFSDSSDATDITFYICY